MKVISWIKNNKVATFIIIWLILGIIAFIFRWVTYSEINWVVLTGVATWVLAAGVFFAFLQLSQARKNTKAQIAVELFNKLRDKYVLNTLRQIYELNPRTIKSYSNITRRNDKKFIHRIESVLDQFELLGALVSDRIIDDKLAIEAYGGPPVLKCWYQLGEHFIKEIRKQRGLYCNYVEDFAARTFNHQRTKAPENEWICFRRGTKGRKINLIKYYIEHVDLQPKRQN